MANRYAVATGNWSNPAIWDGGTLPTSADTVRPNNFTVTIDQNITVLELFNNASAPAVSGGGFVLQDGFIINATTIRANTATLITYSGTTSAIINAAILIANNTSSVGTLIHSGSGTLTINGSINDTAGNNTNGTYGVLVSGTGTLNVNGNIIGGTNVVNFGTAQIALRVTNNLATVNIVGNLTGGPTSTPSGSNDAVRIESSGTLNITGNIIGSAVSNAFGLRITGTNPFVNILSGTIQATSQSSGLVGGSTNLILFNCTIINTDLMACNVGSMKLSTTGSITWQFNTQNALVTKTLYDVNTLPTIPTVNNVRSGVSYASGALTGTLVVPPANAVTAGVVYDNGTIGTAQNTADSFLTALAASSDPLAVRLQNVATVQTTGDQIAAASPS